MSSSDSSAEQPPPKLSTAASTEPSEPMTDSMRTVMGLDGDPARLAAFYDQWASYYDTDVGEHDYGLPEMILRAVRVACDHDETAARYKDRSLTVLDAGCGTGLVGMVLHQAGYTDLCGIDLSHEMAERARERGIYRHVEGGVDLSQPVPDHLIGTADIVVVGGVFTVGHVPPEALATVADLVAPGGLLAVSTRRSYQDATDFVAVQQQMVDAGRLELLAHLANAPYTMDSTGDYWAWRVATAAAETRSG